MDKMLKVQAASDQLKRDNALLSSEVNNLQARKESLIEQLADVSDAHATTKEELCNATKTISELKTYEARARGTSSMRLLRVMFEKQALQMRLESQPPPVMGVLHQTYGVENPPLPAHTS